MQIVPLQIKNRTVEIGFRGHSCWGVGNLKASARPIVIGDFHLFVSFQVRLLKRRRAGERGAAGDRYSLCTNNEQGGIRLWKGNNQTQQNETLLNKCLPDPVYMFYTDFGAWTFTEEKCYPIPKERLGEAAEVALAHLKYLQRVLNVHMIYWAIEGRPPLTQLSVEEVLAKYDPSSRGAE